MLILYLTGLGWLWLGLGSSAVSDWYLHFAQSILLVVSVGIFAVQFLVDSGAPEWRRAQMLAKRLADRNDWPSDLASCRFIPEAKALREALHQDASPALALLIHPRPQVRVAALASLEFKKQWGPGQAELVLHVAQQCQDPAIRAAAVTALANIDDRQLVEQVAEFLRDPSVEVRCATREALLWDTGTRWAWIRHAVRRALSDQNIADAGPLLPEGQRLSPEAVKDLTAWASEKGILAQRAAKALGVHYGQILGDRPEPKVLEDLQKDLINPHASTALRLELACLLQNNHQLHYELQEKLLDSLNPAPLRLIAAEALLEEGPHSGAVEALRSVASLPNREIALATARVVQRRLGVEMGLGLAQTLPPVHSRQAAEVTRRIMLWATQTVHAENPVSSEPAIH